MVWRAMNERIHEFGPFRYDAGQRLLFRNGEAVPLVPKAVDTLHVLLERRGKVVEKAELMKLVWPDTVVEEIGLARNISTLRKALGDEEGIYIATVPKRGYRFVGEKSGAGRGRVSRPVRIARGAALAVTLLAVLVYWQFYHPSRYLPGSGVAADLAVVPFECLSRESAVSSFAVGLDELVLAEVAKLDGVRVTSPSTVRRYRDMHIPMPVMARVLGLDVILEGSVQKVDGQILVIARLADVHSGKLIWADSFGYPALDPAAAQKQAAVTIAARAGAHLSIRGQVQAP